VARATVLQACFDADARRKLIDDICPVAREVEAMPFPQPATDREQQQPPPLPDLSTDAVLLRELKRAAAVAEPRFQAPQVSPYGLCLLAQALCGDAGASPTLRQAVSEAFMAPTTRGHKLLRWCLADLRPQYACTLDPDALARLVARDFDAGHAQSDQSAGLRAVSFGDLELHAMLPRGVLDALGALKPSLFASEGFVAALLRTALPPDVDDDAAAAKRFLEAASAVADKAPPQAVLLRAAVLYHRLRADRVEHKPALPRTDVGRERLRLLKRYLALPRTGMWGGVPHTQRLPANTPHDGGAWGRALGPSFPPPTPQQDSRLVEDELFEWFSSGVETAEFEKEGVDAAVLKALWERAHGLAAAAAQPRIEFCDFNDRHFAPSSEPVTLHVQVSGGVREPLAVSVFKLDAAAVLRQLKWSFGTDVDLDGVVPHVSRTVQLLDQQPGGVQRLALRVEGTEEATGLFVVDVAAQGVASRALVWKGAVRPLVRVEAHGHVVQAVDVFARRVVERASLWVEGEGVFESGEDGTVVVPFAAEARDVACVLSVGGASHLFSLQRRKLAYALSIACFVPPEALAEGNAQAHVVVRPRLDVGGACASLQLLSGAVLTVAATDASGVVTETAVAVPRISAAGEMVAAFPVAPRLARLRVSMSAKVLGDQPVEAPAVDVPVSSPAHVFSWFAEPVGSDGATRLSALGRNGEPMRRAVPFALRVQHAAMAAALEYAGSTDDDGSALLRLGPAVRLVRVAASGGMPEFAFTFSLPGPETRQVAWRVLRVGERAVLDARVGTPARAQTVLVEIDGSAPTRDCFALLAEGARGTECTFDAPGVYVFVPRVAALNVSAARGWLHGGEGAVAAGAVLIHVVDGVAGAGVAAVESRPVQPLALRSVALRREANALDVEVAAGASARVHIVLRRFLDESPRLGDALATRRAGGPAVAALERTPSEFVNGRQLGDELVYCARRQGAHALASVPLPPPSLLVLPRDCGEAPSTVVGAREGTRFAKAKHAERRRGAPAAAMFSAQPNSLQHQMQPPPPQQQASLFGGGAVSLQAAQTGFAGAASFGAAAAPPMPFARASGAAAASATAGGADARFDFVASPSVCVCNLAPAEGATAMRVALPAGAWAWADVVLCDADGQSASWPVRLLDDNERRLPARDIRHAPPRKDAHVVERACGVAVGPEGGKVPLAAGAQWAAVESVPALFALLRAEHGSLGDWEALARWAEMGDGAKAALFESKPCVELAFFAKMKDAGFFARVVRPCLEARLAKSLLDRLLLDEPVRVPDDAEAARLNAFERALLQRATGTLLGSAPAEERWLHEQSERLARRAVRAAENSAGGGAGAGGGGGVESDDSDADLVDDVRAVKRATRALPRALRAGPEMRLMDPFANDTANNDDEDDGDRGGAYADAMLVAETAAASARAYKKVRVPHVYRETDYWQRPSGGCGPFWDAFARQSGEVVSRDVLAGSPGEALLMLGAIALPLRAASTAAAARWEGDGVATRGAALVFSVQAEEAEGAERAAGLLVGATVVDGDGSEVREFVRGEAYTLRACVTSTGQPLAASVLVHVPQGAIALGGAEATQSRTAQAMLQPFATQTVAAAFYWPEAGSFDLFPPHVFCSGALVGWAEPRAFAVGETRRTVNEQSWEQVARAGTLEQVLVHVRKSPRELELGGLLGRLRSDAAEWRAVHAAMRARGWFDARVSVLGFVHGDDEAGKAAVRAVMRLGQATRFECALASVRPEARADEVAEVINARAHRLGDGDRLANASLAATYSGLLARLACQSAAEDGDLVELALCLHTMGRSDEARAALAQVRQRSMQADYLGACIALALSDEAELPAVRALAARHAGFPLAAWRARWAAVEAVCAKLDNAAAAAAAASTRDGGEEAATAAAPEMEISAGAGVVVVETARVRGPLEVSVYAVDVELLFSARPFAVASDLDWLAMLRPSATVHAVVAADGRMEVALPSEFATRSCLVRAACSGVQARTATVFPCAFKLAVREKEGKLVVTRNGQPVARAYCKVYARTGPGAPAGFFKDGYTSLLGEFDYLALNTRQAETASEFSVYVEHAALGSTVRRVAA